MTYISENIEIKAFSICIENEGKITIPEDLKVHLSLVTGDTLTLYYYKLVKLFYLLPNNRKFHKLPTKLQQ